MGILANSNRKICVRLALRCLRRAPVRTLILGAAVFLVTVLFTVSFYMTDGIREAYLMDDQIEYGSSSHIIFSGLSEDQARRVAAHESVESSARLDSLGDLSADSLEYRQVHLALADRDYAETMDALPREGRMPEREGEIALDTLTLDSLGIAHKLGEPVETEWTPWSGGETRKETFTLCGYWSTENGHTESCAWISGETFARLLKEEGGGESLTLGVTLWQPENLDEQAGKILEDLGIEGVSWSSSLAWNPSRLASTSGEVREYLLVVVFVLLCGFLLIYNLLLVSAGERARLLEKMKAMGMTPAQTRVFSSALVLLPGATAVPAGLAAGAALFFLLAPDMLEAMTGIRIDAGRLSWEPLVLAALAALLTAWLAGRAALGRMKGRTPAEIRSALERTNAAGRGRKREKVTVWNLACRSLRMRKGSLTVAALSLFLASVMLGSMYIRYISYDADYYAAETFQSDYSLVDASCATQYQRYNEYAANISPQFGEEVQNLDAVEEYGAFLTREVDLQADDSLRELVLDFYNAPVAEGEEMTRRESMEGAPDWTAGLERLEETGVYRSVLIGAEGLALDCATYYDFISGSFDPEKFATGDYVLAVGATSQGGLSAAPAGSEVTIGGKTFTVMAAVQEWGIVPSGQNSREAGFSLNYVMTPEALRELYPQTSIRQIMVNVKPGREAEFERFLAENTGDGIVVEPRQEAMADFWREVRAVVAVGVLTGFLLLAAGILNFLNVTVSRVLARTREFALYQSLGMGRKQLGKLVMYEGLLYAGICLAGILPLGSVSLWYGMAAFYESDWAYLSSNDWAVTYRYSAAPLGVIGAVILAIGVLVPRICLFFTEKESVVDRIRYKE